MKKLICLFLPLLFSISYLNAQVVVKVKPVPPRAVIKKPPKPGPNFIWIEGTWRWDKKTKQYIWVPGHWEKIKPNAVWVEGHWVKTPQGWKWVPGHWKKKHR